ncbi:MAG: hypothetical protein K2O94_02275, partial [Clostridiales bacterium]|nr:hypothetical protein [Clostridiales bacterium]
IYHTARNLSIILEGCVVNFATAHLGGAARFLREGMAFLSVFGAERAVAREHIQILRRNVPN